MFMFPPRFRLSVPNFGFPGTGCRPGVLPQQSSHGPIIAVTIFKAFHSGKTAPRGGFYIFEITPCGSVRFPFCGESYGVVRCGFRISRSYGAVRFVSLRCGAVRCGAVRILFFKNQRCGAVRCGYPSNSCLLQCG